MLRKPLAEMALSLSSELEALEMLRFSYFFLLSSPEPSKMLRNFYLLDISLFEEKRALALIESTFRLVSTSACLSSY